MSEGLFSVSDSHSFVLGLVAATLGYLVLFAIAMSLIWAFKRNKSDPEIPASTPAPSAPLAPASLMNSSIPEANAQGMYYMPRYVSQY